jgi:ABC-2 type transport system permease protein
VGAAVSVVWILTLRQLKRYARARARIVGALGQPLLFLVAMGFGFGPMYARANGGGSYIQFLAPGIVAMGILFTSVFSGIEIIWDRQFGFLKETLVAPVSRLQIMLGRTLGGALVALIQGCIVLAACCLVGFRFQHWAELPLALLFMALIAIVFAGLGTAFGSVLEDMQAFPLIMNFVVMPLFFFSGALYPLDGVPPVLHFLIRLNPLTYGVDGLRGALTSGFPLGLGTDLAVLGALAAVMVGIGSYFFSKIQL